MLITVILDAHKSLFYLLFFSLATDKIRQLYVKDLFSGLQ